MKSPTVWLRMKNGVINQYNGSRIHFFFFFFGESCWIADSLVEQYHVRDDYIIYIKVWANICIYDTSITGVSIRLPWAVARLSYGPAQNYINSLCSFSLSILSKGLPIKPITLTLQVIYGEFTRLSHSSFQQGTQMWSIAILLSYL